MLIHLKRFTQFQASIYRKLPPGSWQKLASLSRQGGSKIALLQILVVGLTFLKEIVMTAFLGLAQFMDAYTLVNNILIFTRSYFEQLGYGALIPAVAQCESAESSRKQAHPVNQPAQTDQHDAPFSPQRLLVVLLNYTILFTLLVGGAIGLLHQPIAQLIAPSWSGEKLQHLLLLTWLVLPSCFMFQVAEMFRVLCIQEKRFALYQLPRITSLLLFIVSFVLLLKMMGPMGLVIALPLSQLVELLMYCVGLKIRPRWVWRTEGSASFLQKIIPVSLTWGVFSLTALVDNYFLSFLPTGEPSAFRYAYVSVLIAGSLTVVNLQMVKLADLNQACSEQDLEKALAILKGASVQILLWSLPLIVGSVVFAPWLIKVVYERGAFTAHNTMLVSQCYQILIVMVPYTALWRLMSSCFYNLNLIRPLLLIGVVLLALRIGMDWLGLQLMGLHGLSWMVLMNSYLLLMALGLFLLAVRNRLKTEGAP
ncbi:lipid II flippase MurJ [Vampirovibrio chlorellavorus]|uniref:lipid II flippase MurJ n=1 Tax=Vampirovibrio chlorellavorus TaxID=758823 RepID=UPI0026EEE818|nr:lipid II flippase MurJ [Vampirovibrio chlorellavorus]